MAGQAMTQTARVQASESPVRVRAGRLPGLLTGRVRIVTRDARTCERRFHSERLYRDGAAAVAHSPASRPARDGSRATVNGGCADGGRAERRRLLTPRLRDGGPRTPLCTTVFCFEI